MYAFRFPKTKEIDPFEDLEIEDLEELFRQEEFSLDNINNIDLMSSYEIQVLFPLMTLSYQTILSL